MARPEDRFAPALLEAITSTRRENTTIVRCRYLRRNGEQCTGEAIDPGAEILLCAKHAGRVMRLVKERAQKVRRAAR